MSSGIVFQRIYEYYVDASWSYTQRVLSTWGQNDNFSGKEDVILAAHKTYSDSSWLHQQKLRGRRRKESEKENLQLSVSPIVLIELIENAL